MYSVHTEMKHPSNRTERFLCAYAYRYAPWWITLSGAAPGSGCPAQRRAAPGAAWRTEGTGTRGPGRAPTRTRRWGGTRSPRTRSSSSSSSSQTQVTPPDPPPPPPQALFYVQQMFLFVATELLTGTADAGPFRSDVGLLLGETSRST